MLTLFFLSLILQKQKMSFNLLFIKRHYFTVLYSLIPVSPLDSESVLVALEQRLGLIFIKDRCPHCTLLSPEMETRDFQNTPLLELDKAALVMCPRQLSKPLLLLCHHVMRLTFSVLCKAILPKFLYHFLLPPF